MNEDYKIPLLFMLTPLLILILVWLIVGNDKDRMSPKQIPITRELFDQKAGIQVINFPNKDCVYSLNSNIKEFTQIFINCKKQHEKRTLQNNR